MTKDGKGAGNKRKSPRMPCGTMDEIEDGTRRDVRDGRDKRHNMPENGHCYRSNKTKPASRDAGRVIIGGTEDAAHYTGD